MLEENFMKIIESFIMSKGISACEDALFTGDGFVCVIDGITSRSTINTKGLTRGRLACDLIIDELNDMPYDVDPVSFFKALNEAIYQYYRNMNVVDAVKKSPVKRAGASVIAYSRHHNQVWSVGDCMCIVDNQVYNNGKYIDELLAELRAYVNITEIASGVDILELQQNDPGRAFIIPLIEKQMLFQNNMEFNSPYNYSVIDGFFCNYEDIKIIDNESSEVVLASDGYPKLFNDLCTSEAYLMQVLRTDPLLIYENKSTKGKTPNQNSYDDRTYVRFTI